MANLDTAFTSVSPFQEMNIHSSSTSQQLLQEGYRAITINQQTAALCSRLQKTVHSIQDFFWKQYQIVGVDNKGSIPPFFIHLPQNQAFYLPNCFFAFNDAYVSCPEVVCHEFTHAVIHHRNSLGNQGESGALNESIADVVGVVFKQFITGNKEWTIATRDLTLPFSGWKDTTPQYDGSKKTTNDYGNVHDNSLFASHAFYLASTDLAKSNADPGNQQLLKIWWEAFESLTDGEKNFQDFAARTIQRGNQQLFAIGAVIKTAWQDVQRKI